MEQDSHLISGLEEWHLPPGHRRYFLYSKELRLPLFIESIGWNGRQENVERPGGYPCYHWLQTVKGRGWLQSEGVAYELPEHTGLLLPPGQPHQYGKEGSEWETLYITFSGPQAADIQSSLGISGVLSVEWDPDCELDNCGMHLLDFIAGDPDRSGLDASAHLYRFLTLIKKHGRSGGLASISHNVERLAPLLAFMENHYGDPGIGLQEMAAALGISQRYLNILFKQSFGMTAYAYLIMLRMRKAKELMTAHRKLSIKETASLVGFRDVSHFVATFRRLEGVTPEQFRTLY
ncbi:AraC family transcriptional regulator [Paenibacillus sp. JX-17]|uniref:AraC family transcriptional regulator n=1 Tax=Paenibacillus lacisoli TaxID=3064525 RepID=A0ABT9C9F7_9BACL|nr:AraC family transcriptional regulator [Paenibacillus sp. JX-17]MDO7905895.1 AraC family transcriptional regulator [Paenibacillus sp. JX-17]